MSKTIKFESWPEKIEDGPITKLIKINCEDRLCGSCEYLGQYECNLFDALLNVANYSALRLPICMASEVSGECA